MRLVTDLVPVRLIADDLPERILRVGGRDQRVKPGGTIEAYPGEVERLLDQQRIVDGEPVDIWQRAGGVAADADSQNPIGATGDPEAVREFNRLSQGRGDSPTLTGVEDQSETVATRSADDHELQTRQRDPLPQPVDAATEGIDAATGEQPVDAVRTDVEHVGEPVDLPDDEVDPELTPDGDDEVGA